MFKYLWFRIGDKLVEEVVFLSFFVNYFYLVRNVFCFVSEIKYVFIFIVVIIFFKRNGVIVILV